MSASIEDAAVKRDGFPRPVPKTPLNVIHQFQMRGKVVVVAGAGDGIGLAVAEGMAEANADVVLLYNRNDAAIERAEEISNTHGVKASAYKVNGGFTHSRAVEVDPYADTSVMPVSKAEEVGKMVADIVKDYGKIDVFVANAGIANSKGILDMSLDEYRELMSVNVDGVVYCAKYVGEVFKKQGSGNLIITSSISAHIVNVPVDQPVYNGGKAFVSHFGKSLAREWRDFARVNIVSPGFFDTRLGAGPSVVNEAYRMAVLGRQGDTKEIKGLYLYLASDASSYTTGSDILIDGGYTLP
ncbi:sorbose reductase [Geosmithia morbida]|uniref:Sorbose reductase n=1 Tax=Geosmithia morbida TaxID=1094350 RepID=A0A9P4Z0N0_9HYPO|nr:sorbose reductase [Geosmithia morbida]KAF4125515.1 sorbose reductase [Geosmithia morbida]